MRSRGSRDGNAFGITLTVLAVVLTIGVIWFSLTR
jgi:hypothetical protein